MGNGVLIVDAGGGTIDISAYRQQPNSNGQSYEEIIAPQCTLPFSFPALALFLMSIVAGHFQGSIFVTSHARVILDGE